MSYPYHSMLLPIEYYKDQGPFPNILQSYSKSSERFRVQIVLSRSSQDPNLFWHIGPSHIYSNISTKPCVIPSCNKGALEKHHPGSTFSCLGLFSFFAILPSRSCASLTPPFAPTTVVIVVFFVHKILRSKCISTHPKDRQARVTLNYLGSSFRL